MQSVTTTSRRRFGVTATAALITCALTLAACESSGKPSSSAGQLSQAQGQRAQQDAVRFSGCMRSHGVPDFPDAPTAGDPSSGRAFKNAFNTQSPAFLSADASCQHLLPSRQSSDQGSAPSQKQITAALAFAHCIRSRGFPHFPDPTSSGQLTHEMVAAAGINLNQPAVLRAGYACTAVTHGVITKATVARFVAGR
jgi:hypothetical protein